MVGPTRVVRGGGGGWRRWWRLLVLTGYVVVAPLNSAPRLPWMVGPTGPVERVGGWAVSLVTVAGPLRLRPLTGPRGPGSSLGLRLSLLTLLDLSLGLLLLLVIGELLELRRRLLVVCPAGVADLHPHELLQEDVAGQL